MNPLLNDYINPAKNISPAQIKKLNKVSDISFKFEFGKYNGRSVEEILKEDPGYIIWVNDKLIQGIRFSVDIMTKAVKANNDPLEEVFGPMVFNDDDLQPF